MEDAKYVYLQDIKEKKSTGRSAHNRRTHAGKGGAVRFPSDFMTRKEKNAMNGEVKSYKLNRPMTWVEFKAMPDDIKTIYIQQLRDRYNVPDSVIARLLFKIHRPVLCVELKNLGLNKGHSTNKNYKEMEFADWLRRDHSDDPPVAVESPDPEPVAIVEPETVEQVAPPVYTTAIPQSGNLTFCGDMAESLHTALQLLKGAKGKITISWECDFNG